MENKTQKQDVRMTSKQIEIIKTTWAMVTPLGEQAGLLFYNRLIEVAPETKPLFQHTTIAEQSKKLLVVLGYVISKLDKLETLLDDINALGQRHAQYGVTREHYEKGGEALLWTLEQGLQSAWTDEARQAWIACYTLLSGAMLQAAGRKMVA